MNGLPAELALDMLAAVPRRVSRRSYSGERIDAERLERLEGLAGLWHPWPSARVVVIPEAPPALFMGIVGAYGGVSHAPSALAFVGSPLAADEVGYTGEALVLAATTLGLSTCWVAGVFRPGVASRLARLRQGEKVFAVSALGHVSPDRTFKERVLSTSADSRHRRPLAEIAPGHEEWPSWAQAAVATARLAPSGVNRQPWRFSYAEDGLTVSAVGMELPRAVKRLDCGIAMFHAELGAFGEGVTGSWRRLESPGVAVFTPELA